MVHHSHSYYCDAYSRSKTITRQTRIAVRSKKMYGKQNDAEKKDNNDDDNDVELTSNAMKIALPRDINMLTSCRARGRW